MQEDSQIESSRLAILQTRCRKLTIATFTLGIAWLGTLVYLLSFPHRSIQADEPVKESAVKSQKGKTTMSQQGKIIGIGGIFFKSANQQQMKEWYAKHLGLGEGGHEAMLPWREKDNPESEQMTVWSIFPGNTKYFEPSSASFMLNYIVDDLDALLDRLAKEGVRIDPKRQDESYGRFAWIYDPDGNKIELWQPHH